MANNFIAPMIQIYACKDVKEVQRIHQPIVERTVPYDTVKEQLYLMVENLYQHYKAGDEGIVYELRNCHPSSIGQSTEFILNQSLKRFDFELTIAREYGYSHWHDVEEQGNQSFDNYFEQALHALLHGEEETLLNLLKEHPLLLHQRSPYAHKAGLIHYVAANGVEIWRQQVPSNLVEITKKLLSLGIDKDMKSQIYGGESKVTELIASSAHPLKAGIRDALLALF